MDVVSRHPMEIGQWDSEDSILNDRCEAVSVGEATSPESQAS
jgi:hypothetical protein